MNVIEGMPHAVPVVRASSNDDVTFQMGEPPHQHSRRDAEVWGLTGAAGVTHRETVATTPHAPRPLRTARMRLRMLRIVQAVRAWATLGTSTIG